jgi:BMFP domain-containing protein YqiC
MESRKRVFDDAARVAGGALSILSGIRREVEGLVRHQLDRVLSGMDLVTRDEFNAVKEMAARARTENERLEGRIAALEAAQAKPAASARVRPKSTAKKPPDNKA